MESINDLGFLVKDEFEDSVDDYGEELYNVLKMPDRLEARTKFMETVGIKQMLHPSKNNCV